MEVQGTIKTQTATETFGNDFTKCNLVLTTDEQYPQVLAIEFVKDKIDLLNNFKAGDSVKVSINLRGREWTNPQGEVKYFSSLQGWRIEKSDVPAEATAEQTAPTVANDDLPF